MGEFVREVVTSLSKDGEWWQYTIILTLFFATIIYLAIDRLRNGPYSDLMKWKLVLVDYDVSDIDESGDPSNFDILESPTARVVSTDGRWFVLNFDRAWRTQWGSFKTVRVRSGDRRRSIANIPVIESMPVKVELGNGRFVSAHISLKFLD
jgi:hypothetical protein